MPVAVLASWQPAQFVAVLNPLWSTLAPAQVAVDLWQLSHTVALVCTGVLGLPTARVKPPVWQVAHDALTPTLPWNFAGANAVKPPRWQVSQEGMGVGTVVGMCSAVLPFAVTPWQVAQVPLPRPRD